MLTWLKWIFRITLLVFAIGFLHYTLPQRDIVRVTGTEILRKDFSNWTRIFYAQADSGDSESVNRDLRLITTVRANGNVSVYRNEDTGFGWPPYFKLDSSNLQAEATDAASTKENPRWFIVRHYGWRNNFWSIYPNAVSIKEIEDPNVRLIPWFNIILLTLLFALFWAIYVRWRRFISRRVDPMLDSAAETWDELDAKADETRGRMRRWFSRK